MNSRSSRRAFLHLAAGAVALPAVSRGAWAQAYPSRPVRLISAIPRAAPPTSRAATGQWLSERLGQSVVVESRPGGGTNIATEAVVRAAPDGYTLLLVAPANAINATLYDKLGFDFLATSSRSPASSAFPTWWMSIRRSRSGRSPSWSPAKAIRSSAVRQRLHDPHVGRAVQDDDRHQHGACALPRRRAGADRPDRRSGAGDVRQHPDLRRPRQERPAARTRRDRRRALAVLPDLPTVAEFLPGYEASAWYGLGAPKDTPAGWSSGSTPR